MRGLSIVIAAAALTGCGTSAQQSAADAGQDSQAAETASPHQRAFDVFAELTPMMGAGSDQAERNTRFTLFLDSDARQATVGANGTAAVVPVTIDGATVRIAASFAIGAPPATCGGGGQVGFTSLSIRIIGSRLQGEGVGQVSVSCGDCFFNVPFTATVSGEDDATPPGLLVASGTVIDPFQRVTFVASEPLPATATARLVASDGTTVDLVPTKAAPDDSLIAGFITPELVLPLADAYVATTDGLVDFAGLRGGANETLRLPGAGSVPLLEDGGFESVTGTTFGGAGVVTGGPVPPIAGARSLYIVGAGAPLLDGAPAGGSLKVRIARPTGASKLRFSYRSIAMAPTGALMIGVLVGSVGHSSVSDAVGGQAGSSAQVMGSSGQTLYVTDVALKEIQLPTDASDEVVVELSPGSFACAGGPLLLPLGSGLLIDDLRVE